MIDEAIVKLVDGEDLSGAVAEAAMDEIMGGRCTQNQIAAFLTALTIKEATITEITACAKGMRSHAVKLLNDQPVLEIVGTGGDRANSFNISTVAAIVVSAGGVPVAKHGNRAATSRCGTADCLEALGAAIDLPPEKSEQVLDALGFCFMFAQNYHLSMKYVAPVRKELPIPTVFNILGPLTNPAGATMQLMGVYDESLVEPLARVLSNLGVTRAMVVYGWDGLDEISASSPTTVCEVIDGRFTSYTIHPEDYGIALCRKQDLMGGTPAENAVIARSVLAGEAGARRNAVLLNAGAGIHIATGEPLANAIKKAAALIDSGAAAKQLDDFVALTSGLKGA
ncbi:anthranilate phosphoribosyltransferase [Pseudoramibacter alactolyticus]